MQERLCWHAASQSAALFETHTGCFKLCKGTYHARMPVVVINTLVEGAEEAIQGLELFANAWPVRKCKEPVVCQQQWAPHQLQLALTLRSPWI